MPAALVKQAEVMQEELSAAAEHAAALNAAEAAGDAEARDSALCAASR